MAVLAGLTSFARDGVAGPQVRLELTPDPMTPEPGDNRMRIMITDGEGRPVEGATVGLVASMPAMGTMPRMEETATVEAGGGGQYLARYALSMGGSWEIQVDVTVGADKTTEYHSVTTGIPGVSRRSGEESAPAAGQPQTAAAPGATVLDVGSRRLQLAGVRFAVAELRPLRHEVLAVGVVEQDDTHREAVVLRYGGYVVKQLRGRVGEAVKAGEPLFTVYSPELVSAQSEYLLAGNLGGANGSALAAAAAEKLKNMGMTAEDLATLRRTGKPAREQSVRAAIGGTILEIGVREGSAVAAGQTIYLIGDLSRSYVVARVFQQEVGLLVPGQKAVLKIPGIAGDDPVGAVDLIYPQLGQGAGTANVRVEVLGQGARLKPGAYAEVVFPVELGERLVVPTEAVLYSGRHRYVFVDLGAGRLEPRAITVGVAGGDLIEIVTGLKAGERVAASGTFLLSSEAQLRSALPKWGAGDKAAP